MTATHRLRDLLRDPVYLRIWLVGGFSGIARWLEYDQLEVSASEGKV